MSDPLSIYQSIARLMFPKGLLDYFTVVNVVERISQSVNSKAWRPER